jgi:ABC-type nickel/cobalt efflux system permease component RcnA
VDGVEASLIVLCGSAASIALLHTLFGPDHYLPFVVMSRARGWTVRKTVAVTVLCGLGHVGSSIFIGLLGVGLGVSLAKLTGIEAIRGSLAAWVLIGFGLLYFVWGLRRALRGRDHLHEHAHVDRVVHVHRHRHDAAHAHLHQRPGERSLTPWVLFTIFVLGPCEPLIPLLLFPAAKESLFGVFLVASVFGAVTIVTMGGVVAAASIGLHALPLGKLERYAHALAGATIGISGMAIQFLGL